METNDIKFAVDNGLKKSLSHKVILSTPGGKAGLAVAVILVLLGFLFAGVVSMLGVKGAFAALNPYEDLSFFFSVATFAVFATVAVCVFLVTRSTLNKNLSMRRGERLFVLDGKLFYSFRFARDSVHGLTEVLIDLSSGSTQIGNPCDNLQRITFDKGVRWHHYANSENESRCSEDEMNELDGRFEIYDYWQPSLSRYLNNRNTI